MNSERSKNIIRDLCRRYNIKPDQADEIIRSQFRMVKIVMESYNEEKEYTPSIRLHKFGLFFVKPSKKKNYGKKD